MYVVRALNIYRKGCILCFSTYFFFFCTRIFILIPPLNYCFLERGTTLTRDCLFQIIRSTIFINFIGLRIFFAFDFMASFIQVSVFFFFFIESNKRFIRIGKMNYVLYVETSSHEYFHFHSLQARINSPFQAASFQDEKFTKANSDRSEMSNGSRRSFYILWNICTP